MKHYKRVLRPISNREKQKVTLNDQTLLDFSNNDYLGLSTNKNLIKESLERFKSIECFGSTSSRLLSGNTQQMHLLETLMANYLEKEDALLFCSGYQLNVSFFNAVTTKKTIVFCDKACHASILDGLKLANCVVKRFANNKVSHLIKLLNKYRHQFEEAWLVVESVYSMDASCAPLKEFVELKKEYNLKLYVDEAHSFGIFGQGKGLSAHLNVLDQVDCLAIPCGKALGAHGAILVCSRTIKESLINCCRGFIYSTALPSTSIIFLSLALEHIIKNPSKGQILLKKVNNYKKKVCDLGFKVLGDSHILPILIKDTESCIQASKYLLKSNLYILPIVHPTVAQHAPRLRISLSLNHQDSDLNHLTVALSGLRAYA